MRAYTIDVDNDSHLLPGFEFAFKPIDSLFERRLRWVVASKPQMKYRTEGTFAALVNRWYIYQRTFIMLRDMHELSAHTQEVLEQNGLWLPGRPQKDQGRQRVLDYLSYKPSRLYAAEIMHFPEDQVMPFRMIPPSKKRKDYLMMNIARNIGSKVSVQFPSGTARTEDADAATLGRAGVFILAPEQSLVIVNPAGDKRTFTWDGSLLKSTGSQFFTVNVDEAIAEATARDEAMFTAIRQEVARIQSTHEDTVPV